MIAKQKIHKGNNFIGAFDYNDQKLNHQDPTQRATLLEHNFINYDRQAVSNEILILQQLRPKLTRDAYHVSLNFAPEDKLNINKLLDITREYMKGMGFEDNLYSIWQHHDAEHLHVHLLCSRIRFDGMVVSDSNNYKRSEALCRQLEIKYDLQRVRSSTEATERAPSKDEIEMIQRTGKLSNRMLMQEKVKNAMSRSVGISDFIKNCEKQGVYLIFNQSTSTGRVSGITYVMDDFVARGQALGNMFKWKSISEIINYEQGNHTQTISETNDRTRTRFSELLSKGNEQSKTRNNENFRGSGNHLQEPGGITSTDSRTSQQQGRDEAHSEGANGNQNRIQENEETSRDFFSNAIGSTIGNFGGLPNIAFTDDVDDEAMKKRRKRKR